MLHSPKYTQSYIGRTKRYHQREYQHTLAFRNMLSALEKETKAFHLSRITNQFVYRFISSHEPASFTMTPLVRIHNVDAMLFEYLCIKTLARSSINTDKTNPNKIFNNQLTTRNTKKRKRHHSSKKHSNKLPFQKQQKQLTCKKQTIFNKRLFRINNSQTYYLRLIKLIDHHHEEKSIEINSTPGKINYNNQTLMLQYGTSPVSYRQTTTTLNKFAKQIQKSRSALHFTIQPIKTLTTHQQTIIWITTVNDMSADTVQHFAEQFATFSAYFWLTLFKTANPHTDPMLTRKVRFFVRQYMFLAYNIPTTELNRAINLN